MRVEIQSKSMFARFLSISCLVVIIFVSTIVMSPFVRATSSDGNSAKPSVITTPLMPTEESVNPITTNVDSTTIKVKPLEVPATTLGSNISTTSWPYIPLVASVTIFVIVALIVFAIRGKENKFSLIRLKSSLVLISLFMITVTAISVYAENLTVSSWDLKSVLPYSFISRDSVDSAGNVWISSKHDKIGRLDPSTNEIKIWLVPNPHDSTVHGSYTTTIAVDDNDNVWFLDSQLDRIGRLDPSTNFFTIWPIPTSGSNPNSISFDTTGNVFFSEIGSNKIGYLNPSANEITEWAIPTPDSSPQHIMVDSTARVWFVEYLSNKIAELNPATNEITEWPIPTTNSYPSGLYVTKGEVYFTEKGANKIGRLDPSTNKVTQWFVGESPCEIIVDLRGDAWFTFKDSYLGRISSDNILTSWIGYSTGKNCHGLAIDLEENGDVYIASWYYRAFYAPVNIHRINLFHSAAAIMP